MMETDAQRAAVAASVAEKEQADQALALEASTDALVVAELKSGAGTVDVEGDLDLLARRKKELEKLARDSSGTLAVAREEWLGLRGITEGGPARIEALKAEGSALGQQVQLKEAAIKEMRAMLNEQEAFLARFSASPVANETNARDLERDISVLSEKVRILSKDVAKIDKERQERERKIEQQRQKDVEKAEARKSNLELQNRALRDEFDRLRKNMVDLDKKKSQLERRVYGDK
jgi:predicted  nucleic acid-binding Zn-ribbon protein